MAFLRIYCNECGGKWEIYRRDNWNDETARQCPHCFLQINRDVWEKEILPAFNAVHDANAELFKESTGYSKPLFSFDVVTNRLNRKAFRNGR